MKDLSRLDDGQSGDALKRVLDNIPYVRFLGIDCTRMGDRLTFTLPFDDKIIGNPMLPAIHGGVTGAFLEVAAISQLVSEIKSERLPKPINLTVEYLRSGKPQDVYAEATVTKLGRRIANVQAVAWQAERARPIASAHGHFLLRLPEEAKKKS
jgi:uncharacterized protein (TIGR00369 family)